MDLLVGGEAGETQATPFAGPPRLNTVSIRHRARRLLFNIFRQKPLVRKRQSMQRVRDSGGREARTLPSKPAGAGPCSPGTSAMDARLVDRARFVRALRSRFETCKPSDLYRTFQMRNLLLALTVIVPDPDRAITSVMTRRGCKWRLAARGRSSHR